MGWTKPLKKFLSVLPAPAFWLGVWQACAFLVDRSLDGKGNELRLPYPLSVWNALAAMVGTGEFWAAVLTSLGRTPQASPRAIRQIGRASCRERV